MGGVATLISEEIKDSVVKVKEGIENDEYLIKRHTNFLRPLNIINIYGEQESRSSKQEIEERWARVVKDIKTIEDRQEPILLLGDMNKHSGNDDLGVKDNHEKISFGGELLYNLIATKEYICINNLSA